MSEKVLKLEIPQPPEPERGGLLETVKAAANGLVAFLKETGSTAIGSHEQSHDMAADTPPPPPAAIGTLPVETLKKDWLSEGGKHGVEKTIDVEERDPRAPADRRKEDIPLAEGSENQRTDQGDRRQSEPTIA